MAKFNRTPADPRGGHSRIYWDVQDSMAWRALDWSAVGLWLAMRRKLLSFNNGNIEATIETLRHAGFTSPTTLAKGLRSLEAAGLIAKTRQGGVALGQNVCNLFRFTDEPTFAHPKLGIVAGPATHEWKAFPTMAAASAAIDRAHAKVLGTGRKSFAKNKLGEQKLFRADTQTVSRDRLHGTDSVQAPKTLEQKLLQTDSQKRAGRPHAA